MPIDLLSSYRFLSAGLMMCLLLAVQVQANEGSSRDFIAGIAENLQSRLQTAREGDRLSDESYLDALIGEEIVPYLDIRHMAKKVSGSRWDQVQEKQLAEAMEEAVVAALKRTYRVALSAYSGEKILITHSKDYANYSLVRVQVKTDERSHLLDFALRSNGSGEWRVFDVSVDGVVFSKTLQSSLSRQFENDELEAVIERLRGSDSTKAL